MSALSNTDAVVAKTGAPELPSGKTTSFAGDVIKVVLGASSVQFFAVLSAPFLTRMYNPEAFGLMAVCTSLVGAMAVMASLRYEQAILLPKRDDDAANVLVLSLAITAGLSGALALALFRHGGAVLRHFGIAGLGRYTWFVPASVLVSGLYQSLAMWNSRKREFAVVSGSRALAAGVSNTCQLSLGWANMASAGALLGGAFIGNTLGLLLAAVNTWRHSWPLFLASVRWERMRLAARRYFEFPLYNSWGALLNTLSWQLPALLLARYFGSAPAGYFSVGFRVLSIPMDVIALSIGQVFFQRAAEARADGSLSAVVESAVSRLIAYSLFPILTLGLIAPDLFSIALGARWHEAGVYVRLLAPWICIWFVASPLSVLICVLERQRFGTVLNLAIFATRLGSLYVGHLLNSVHFALAAVSATGLVVYGWLALGLIRQSGARVRSFLPQSLKALACALPVVGGIACLRFLGAGSLVQTLAGAIAIIAYLGHETLRDAALLRTLPRQLRGVSQCL